MNQAEPRRVVALGFFDGVHLGHGALLRRARKLADEIGGTAVALSFDAQPRTVLCQTDAPLLSTMSDRERLMHRFYRMDEVLFIHCDQTLLQMPWEDFIDEYLVRRLDACRVVCGDDYRFGHRGEGTPERLQAACAARNIGCNIIPQVDLDGVRVSSTAIRAMLQAGDVPAARRFLGHPHLVGGEVVKGRQLGRTLGVPTANIPFAPGVLVPPYGVYSARA